MADRHDEKTAKDFGVEGGSVLHVSLRPSLAHIARACVLTESLLTFAAILQLVLALRGGML